MIINYLKYFLIVSLSFGVNAQDEMGAAWNIGAYISPEISYRQLRSDDNSLLTKEILRQRDSIETASALFSTGLIFEYILDEKLSLRTGFHYLQRGYRSKSEVTYPPTSSTPEGQRISFIFRDRYHYFGIPLQLSYKFIKKSSLQFGISAGLSLDMLTFTSFYNTVIGPDETENSKDFVPVYANESAAFIFSPSLLISLPIDLKMNANNYIRFEPRYSQMLRPVYDNPIRGYLYNFGLQMGYFHEF